MLRQKFNSDLIAATVSVLIQIPLAIFLGHYYDQTIFLQTGYLVNAGLNPYQPHQISVFLHPHLDGVSNVIGYPPPWTLILGSIYKLTYASTPIIYLYNFAIKLPIIVSNIALAYTTKTLMQQQNMPKKTIQFAWLFLLFNPFTLLTTTAWGQFDTIIALLCLVAIYLLSRGKVAESAMLLTLSFILKPISLPLLGLPLLYSTRKSLKKTLIAATVIMVTVLGLWFLPFSLAGWAMPVSNAQVTSFFEMAGGLTVFNVIDVFSRTSVLPADLWFLGYLWVPLLLAAYVWVFRHRPVTLVALSQAAIVLMLTFYLSRSWLSEQNVNLLFPFLLIVVGAGAIKPRIFHFVWVTALVFLVLNMSVPQLFYLVIPEVISLKEAFDVEFGTLRLIARFAVTVLWFLITLGLLIELTSKSHRLSARKSLNKDSL